MIDIDAFAAPLSYATVMRLMVPDIGTTNLVLALVVVVATIVVRLAVPTFANRKPGDVPPPPNGTV
jgi:hypothetical protein